MTEVHCQKTAKYKNQEKKREDCINFELKCGKNQKEKLNESFQEYGRISVSDAAEQSIVFSKILLKQVFERPPSKLHILIGIRLIY